MDGRTRLICGLAQAILCATAFSTFVWAQARPERGATTVSAAAAKQPQDVPKKREAHDWLRAAEQVTADVVEDDWRLTKTDKAILQTRLCSAWWKTDATRAHGWCVEAADAVSRSSDTETTEQLSTRIAAARIVLRLVSPLDSRLRDQVQDAISTAVSKLDDKSRPREGSAVAESLGQAALDAEGNPALMARFISESLREGGSINGMRALVRLRATDAATADKLFADAITRVAQSRNPQFVGGVLRAVFGGEWGAAGETWRDAVVQAVGAYLATPAASDWEKQQRCGALSLGGNQLRLLTTSETALLRAPLQYCDPAPAPERAPTRLPAQLKTADDFLFAAQQSSDPGERLQLKTTAAIRADIDDKNTERGLEILDDITESEHAARPNTTVRLRRDMAVRAIVAALQPPRNDVATMRRILGRTADRQRVSVEVAVLERGAGIAAVELDRLCSTDLRRYGADDPMDYVRYANLKLRAGTAATRRTAKLHEFTDVMLALDKWRPKDRAKVQVNEIAYAPLESGLAPLPIAAEIVDYELDEVRAASQVLRTLALRISLQLAVLPRLLDRYESARATNRVPARN